MFNFFNRFSKDLGYGDAQYSSDTILDAGELLDYKECMNIYRYFPLGRRLATALPNFALSAEREILFDDLPPEFSKGFRDLENDYDIISIVKKTAIYARIFGVSAIFVSCDNVKPTQPLSFKDIQKNKINFNILDPLNLNGMKIGLDPLDTNYQRVYDIKVRGQRVHISRCLVCFNDLSFYLQYVPSNFNFGSQSIYQNMSKLIRSWNRCVIALERLATKAGAIVYKNREKGALNSIIAYTAKKSLGLIRDMQNDGAVSIDKDDAIEFFSLTGVSEVDSILGQMNQILLMALNDTPAAILLDKELANGFGDGSEDMKAILMAVDNFRKDTLRPIYSFIDRFLLYKLLNDSFLSEMLQKYSLDLKQFDISTLREYALNKFNYKWGNLYPETEATKQDNINKKLTNLTILKDLGANLSDIEQILNNDDNLFKEDITLDYENIARFTELDGDGDDDLDSKKVSLSSSTRAELNEDSD